MTTSFSFEITIKHTSLLQLRKRPMLWVFQSSGCRDLPPPNLNPIERLWKAIKGQLAQHGLIENLAHLNQFLEQAFEIASESLSCAKK
jgi:hypothetical protein